jgi:hypothetical protein
VEPHITRKTKWITFTYLGPCTRTITKLFRNTELKITFRTKNTIKHNLKIKDKTTDKYKLNVAFLMTCKDCPLKYFGQTSHTFGTRYNEHTREIKSKGKTPKYAQHIHNTAHNYENIEKIMIILHIEKKGKMLDTLQNSYIYKIAKQGIQINETSTNEANLIHDFINKHLKSNPL